MDLPPEIIEKIFLEFCSSSTIFPLRRDEPRLLITQVCSQWRAIALAIPSIWANIRISIDSTPILDPIRTWISRSAQSTLSFWICRPTNYRTSSTAILDLIFPIIQRCASLQLYINQPALTRLLSLPPGSLHALQEISIGAMPIPDASILAVDRRATAFQQCPYLRQVTFAFTTHKTDPTDFNLPWHQLTHLNMPSCLSYEYECFDVLRQCTALEECNIPTLPAHFRDLEKVQALSHHPIMLPSLHTLYLSLRDPVGHSVHFVRALCLPRLRSLHPVSSTLPRALLPAFRTLLSETIRHLDLSRWTPTDLPGVLALVPNLETLKLRDIDLEMLRTLSCGGAAPRLVALKLGVVNSCDLFDMLEARAAAVLTDVSAVHSRSDDIDMARLMALRAAGVQVVFRNRSL
ncbi:hypothetical protein BD779DRAFT_767425 [Infundibulicybe gibba]|nr:hypothetical protein BD779DRAFT_767425 [Infundibulicybe gibba]